MSIEVRVPEEISDYKESIVAGRSLRELLWSGIALAIGIPTFYFFNKINLDLATYVTMGVVAPALCLGYIRPNGYPFEKYIRIKFYSIFSKSKRGYELETDNNPINLYMPIEVEKYRPLVQEYIAYEAKEQLQNQLNQKQKKINKGVNIFVRKKECKKAKNARIKRKPRQEYDLVEISEKSSKRKRKTAAADITKATRVNRKEKLEKA